MVCRNEADKTKFLQSVCESVVGSGKEKPVTSYRKMDYS